jgi:hypothetical protein
MSTLKKKDDVTIVPPSIDSGFARRRIPIASGLLGLSILYGSLIYLLQDSVRVMMERKIPVFVRFDLGLIFLHILILEYFNNDN